MDNYNYITETGTIIPDTSTVQTEVENEYKTAFNNQDLIVTPNTPQGIFIATETTARTNFLKNNAAIANQLNPNLAGGIALDAIGALTNSPRGQGTFSAAAVNLAGVASTVVPALTQIANDNGDIFQSVGTVTLDSLGVAQVSFQALVIGPIPAPVGTLTNIISNVPGLETATNPNDAVLGTLEQSDLSYRVFRRNTLALQGQGTIPAMYAGLFATQNVTSVFVQENTSDSTVVKNGVTMTSHSLYACVAGGLDLDVATAILNKKGGGTGLVNGAGIPVTVTIVNPISDELETILFDRPTLKPIAIRVTVSAGPSVQDPSSSVIQAIMDYANGVLLGEPGFKIGEPVSCFEISGAINRELPEIFVHNVETRLISGGSFSNAELSIAVFEQATITQSSITVVVTS